MPSAATPAVLPEQIDPSPRRIPLGDPPIAHIGGFDQRCNACHEHFDSVWDESRPIRQHTDVVLDHGIDAGCLACHARPDREKLGLRDGSMVVFAQAARLCAECHGPVTRDWQRGAHGKTIGYWDPSAGTPRKLSCTECHDPHAPAFAPIAPLPGPNTLRMGEPPDHDPGVGAHRDNPLRRWLDKAPDHTTEADHDE